MAVPKRKTSKSKRDKRRTHDNLKPVNISDCPRCRSKKLAHRVCPECGFYNNVSIIPKEEKEKKEKKTP